MDTEGNTGKMLLDLGILHLDLQGGTSDVYTLLFFKDFIYFFLERGGGRQKERERNTNVREKH